MGSMFNSLRMRLLLTLIAVVTVAIGTVALMASRTTTTEFRRSVRIILDYPNYSIENRINAINKLLTSSRGERTLWADMQKLLEGMGRTSQARFVMADLEGNVVADSTGELTGQQINAELSRPFGAFLIDGEPILAYLMPLQDNSLETVEAQFVTSVNHSLLIAMVVGGLVALLLTLFLSSSIVGPVDALTRAARAMEKGDLSQRVPATASGEVGELARAFNAMADGLDRLEQLRRNMVTDVAHELRTPLSNVRGYLEALKDGVIQPTPELIASLHEEALLLNRLVDDLQELSQAEAGQLSLVRQPVSLQPLVEKSVYLAEPNALAKGVTIRVDIPADLPCIDADAERISQVLGNLLTNAITGTPPGGQVEIRAKRVDSQVQVSVCDTGVGIDPEHLPYVFERFYRADRSRTRATGGAGLGLAIVKQLVEAHGGRVGITSQVGAGTTVSFTTPLAGSSSNGFGRADEGIS
jgi:signal transduction histidine kinase